MMRAVMDKSMLRSLISRAGIIPMDDLNIEYTSDGWRIGIRDSSNIALLEIIVWSNTMQSYECDPYDAEKGEKPQNASVPFKRFIEAVNVLPDGEPVTITDDGGYMRLDAGKIHTRIRIGGIHTRVEVRSMDIDFIFPLNTADVEKLFSASMNVTDMITIACGPEGLSLSVSDDALAGMKYTDPEITSERSMRSNFQLDYVVSALKGIKGNVLISLDNDYPLKIVSNEPFTTVYYLAPRLIEGEAEE